MALDHSRLPHRAYCPPSDSRPYRRIVTAPEGRGGLFIALNRSIQSFLMHWINGRSYPCRSPQTSCQGCMDGLGARWEGYIGVVGLQGRDQFILKVTAGAFRNSPELAALDLVGELRGKWLYCTRCGKGAKRNGPAKIELRKPDRDIHVPEPFDLDGALARQWGLVSLDLLG